MIRVALSPLLLGLMVVLAGCSGALVDAQSTPATIPDSDLASRGYVHQNTTEIPLTYRMGGLVPMVSAKTWAATYTKATDTPQPALFILYSSPNRKVADMSVNPLSQLSNRELIGFVLERLTDFQTLGGVADVSDLREQGTTNLTIFGQPVQMVTYTGEAEIELDRVGIVVNLAVVEHQGDVVVAMGIYPDELDERSNQAALIQVSEHGSHEDR